MRFFMSTLALLLLGVVPASAEPTTVLTCGKLLDVNTRTILDKQLITIDQDRISSIRSGDRYEGEAQVINLSEHTCLPGLIDMHVHLMVAYSTAYELDKIRLGPPDLACLAAWNAELTLMAGFTTVRDLGDRADVTVALRNAIAKGIATGPRVFTSGMPLSSTGGHDDPTMVIEQACDATQDRWKALLMVR